MAFSEEIKAIFTGDTTRLDQAVRSATVKVAEEGKKMAASFLSPWKSIATTLAGYFTYSGIQELGQKMKELRHQAEQFGTSAQFIEGFQKSLKKLGVDPEVAVKLMGRFVTKMGEARSGSEESAKAFDKWGISLYDAAGNALTTEQLLPLVAERMKNVADPALRAAMAFDLFGKSGVQLVPILSQGAKAVEEWKKKARISDAEIQATIEAATALKVATDWATRLAAKLLEVATNLKHLKGNNGDDIDFNSPEYLAFKKEQWSKQGFLGKAGDIGAAVLTGGMSAVLQEAQMRALYKRITTGNEPDSSIDSGRLEAQDQLDKTREDRAFKRLKDADKYNKLIEKAARLEEEIAAFDDENSEGAIRKKIELEAIEDDIAKLEEKANEKIADAQKLGEKEVGTQERIAQLRAEIAGYDADLLKNKDNIVKQAELEEKKARAVNELKEKELSITEKIQTAQKNAQQASADYMKQMRDATGLTVAQLAGDGSANGFDPAAGVRGGSHKAAARRNFRKWQNRITPEERAARDLAQNIQSLEAQADFAAANGHFFDAQDLKGQALDLRGMLPDFAKVSENPMAQAAEKMDELTQLLDSLIKANGGTLPVSMPGAARTKK